MCIRDRTSDHHTDAMGNCKQCQGKTVGRVYDRTVSGVSDPAIYNKLFSTSMEGPYHGYSADRAAGNGYRLHRIFYTGALSVSL